MAQAAERSGGVAIFGGVDVALRDVGSGHGAGGLTIGPGGLRGCL